MELQHTDVASVTPLELLSLERQLLETCQELNMKRKQLTDCHSELDKMVVRQHQLEQTLVEERRKSEAMRLQLEVAVGAVQRCNEDKNSFQAELSRLRVEMEITVRDRDSFKQQYHTYKVCRVLCIP
ncbi:hypothetical protein C0J52_09178 [Blattella germanica]|nr:hypothetical protein C0J52_09178 [Blattella germanica]